MRATVPRDTGRVAFSDLQEFVSALERDRDLRRVRARVDPHLEVTGIVQRVVADGGPALLFENPSRGRMPLLINVFGTPRRMARALGVADLDEIGDRIADLLKPELPRGVGGLKDALGKAAQLRSVPPRKVKGAPCQEVVLRGDDVDLDAAARHQGVAGGRRRLPQSRADPHEAPGDRRAQSRHVPPAAAGQAHGQPALADPQGLDLARGRRRTARRAAAGRDRVRLPARGHLRGVGAAAGRHRRVPVRRLRAARARRHGRLRLRAAAGAGGRAGRARRAGSNRERGCRKDRSATTPASTRRSSRSRSCGSRR